MTNFEGTYGISRCQVFAVAEKNDTINHAARGACTRIEYKFADVRFAGLYTRDNSRVYLAVSCVVSELAVIADFLN